MQLSTADLTRFYAWCDARYFPFLQYLDPSSSILELGCGHGRILNYFRQKQFFDVKGIDISGEQIELARREHLDAERADVFEYLQKQPPASLDCVIAIDFVEHFTKEELFLLFELVHAAMKPGGVLLLQTVNGEGLFPRQIMYGDLTHSTILSSGSMGQLLNATQFHDMHYAECSPVASGITGTLRAIAWNMIRAGANIVRKIESNKTQHVWTENFICSARR